MKNIEELSKIEQEHSGLTCFTLYSLQSGYEAELFTNDGDFLTLFDDSREAVYRLDASLHVYDAESKRLGQIRHDAHSYIWVPSEGCNIAEHVITTFTQPHYTDQYRAEALMLGKLLEELKGPNYHIVRTWVNPA